MNQTILEKILNSTFEQIFYLHTLDKGQMNYDYLSFELKKTTSKNS